MTWKEILRDVPEKEVGEIVGWVMGLYYNDITIRNERDHLTMDFNQWLRQIPNLDKEVK